MEDKKNIEIISGDGSNLEISPVYEHLEVSKPKTTEEKPKYVVIPEESHKEEKLSKKKEEPANEKDNNEDSENNNEDKKDNDEEK